ncbi:Rrf2 family transcriptional regulator [Mucilaginibacter terrae]|uniref:Rrf2 family protein n=1 Tax=Mucilaginibacter terrae TaxID=1955052 RepID=A0ABU3GQT3_9SPHI|nr:Rrf2 family transcriptional regulator [Mucilaginibacter terrae]MDT3401841.1 Rrf2 family protein [Mucilaginibacter terrae]
MTGRFQIAVHIFTLLHAAGDEYISSDYIAGSVNINPVLIRKELSYLRNLGLIASKEGKSGGYTLGKSAGTITMADIYEAVMVNPVLGKARNQPNPKCPIGQQISSHLKNMDAELTRVITEKLRRQTLAEFYKQFNT